MNWVFLVLVSLLPAVLWVWFFYRQDRFEKEPLGMLVRAFGAGMLAVIPAALYEYPFRGLLLTGENPWLRAAVALLVVGLGEEAAKLGATYVTTYRSRAFNEVMDGVIYGITAALGFAAVENLLYTASFGLKVVPARAILASLAHASFSGLAGYYLGLAHCQPQGAPNRVAIGLAAAAVLHAVYDLVVTAPGVGPVLVLAMVYALYRFLRQRIQQAQALSPFRYRT